MAKKIVKLWEYEGIKTTGIKETGKALFVYLFSEEGVLNKDKATEITHLYNCRWVIYY